MTTPTVRRRPGPRLQRSAMAGILILALLVLLAILAPVFAPHDPEAVNPTRVLGAPNASYPFGSDVLGRDVLSRVLYGLRVSLLVSILSVLMSALFAVPLGALAGYFGGWVCLLYTSD